MIELSHKPLIRAFNMDCMTFMAGVGDKAYSLACCDPPYGINGSCPTGTYAREWIGYTKDNDKNWDKEILLRQSILTGQATPKP